MKERKFRKPTPAQEDVLRKMLRGCALLYNIGEVAMLFTPSGQKMFRPCPNVRTVDNLFCRGAIDIVRGRFRMYELTDAGKKLARAARKY